MKIRKFYQHNILLQNIHNQLFINILNMKIKQKIKQKINKTNVSFGENPQKSFQPLMISAFSLLDNIKPNIVKRCSNNYDTRNHYQMQSIKSRKTLFSPLVNQTPSIQLDPLIKCQGKKIGEQYLNIPQQFEKDHSKCFKTSISVLQDEKLVKSHSQQQEKKLRVNNRIEFTNCEEKQREQSSKIKPGLKYRFRIHKIQNKIALNQHKQSSIEDSIGNISKKNNQQLQQEMENNFQNAPVNFSKQSQHLDIPDQDSLLTGKMDLLLNTQINQNIPKNFKYSRFFDNEKSSELVLKQVTLQTSIQGQATCNHEENQIIGDQPNCQISYSKMKKSRTQLKQINLDNLMQKNKNIDEDDAIVNYEELILNYLNKLLIKNGLSQLIINYSWFRRLKEHRIYQIKQYLYMNPLNDKKIFQAIGKYEELLLKYRQNYTKYLKNNHVCQPFDNIY